MPDFSGLLLTVLRWTVIRLMVGLGEWDCS
jgi:hypothetical protein